MCAHKISFTATDVEKRHGRQTRWELRAQETPEHIKANWPGIAWIVEVITITKTCKAEREIACHRFITSLRTTPEALLRLIRRMRSGDGRHGLRTAC
jgi:hypothetical protein